MGQVSTEEDIGRRADENRFMAGKMQPDLQQIYVAPVEKPSQAASEGLSTEQLVVPKPRLSHLRDRSLVADPRRRHANTMQRLWKTIRDAERKRRPIVVD